MMNNVETITQLISSLKSGEKEKALVVYFLGIGGIGMSALARYFHSNGAIVSGYDKTPSLLTNEMLASGIKIHFEENLNAIPKEVDLVVYTPAIPGEHAEYVFYNNGDYLLVKRSDVLGAITNSSFNICVAGTHGKTTTSTLIAHLLRHSGYGCNAFLGGVSGNYQTNFWSSDRNVSVAEADEYDRSFLKLSPDVAVITAMDADHLDIYGTAEVMEDAFIEFAMRIKDNGLLITKFGLKRQSDFQNRKHVTYSLHEVAADARAANIKIKNGSYHFDVILPSKRINDVVLNMGGTHNIENAVAAILVASELGIEVEKIKSAVADFKGVKRRFEYVIKTESNILIDDYAHHPEELRALITSAKDLFKNKKCTVVFQPHLYTRTQDLAAGFAETLDLADEVILLPIYPARELPIAGVDSSLIQQKMINKNVQVLTNDELLKWTETNEIGLLLMAGAGDIDGLIEPIKNIINSK